ncbi:MAG: ketoacyl-ACP synthase III [Chlamydiae bacterium]|nr:ketoacyl-ACP synthase III [Chlamydiota bacterium]
MTGKKAYISTLGTYLPKKILTNQDLEKLVDTSDEWILLRTGMKERHIADEGEYTSDMGAKAAKIALERAKLDPSDVDLIIVATLSPDYTFPSTACLIQAQIGAKNAAAFDIQAACTGMIYALSIGKSFILSGMYKNILIVASEKLSSITDYKDRNTCILFGDGAAACLIRGEGPGLEIGTISLGADGGQSGLLYLPGGGCRNPATTETVNERMHYLKMDGKEVFRHAVRRMELAAVSCINDAKLDPLDIAYLVPHQANTRIIDAIAKRCQIPQERVVNVVKHYGNTSASSIGLALEQISVEHKIKNKDNLLLVAFGAGLTWGSLILTVEGDFKNGTSS